jgi:hypothetical protein
MSDTAFFLGVSAKVAIGATIGGAVGMVMGSGAWWEKLLRGLVGVGSAYVGHTVSAKIMIGFLATVIDEKHLPTVNEAEPVAAFLIGVVGMIACQAAVNAMTAVRDKADDFVDHRLDPPKAGG